ncbi:MAG: restriction endonuclease [Bacteroidota bacterium]
MGGVTFSFREYLDTITELVAVKSGILLPKNNIISILKENHDPGYYAGLTSSSVIRLRAESIEEDVNIVRKKIGNISEEGMNPYPFKNFLQWDEKYYSSVVDEFSNLVDEGNATDPEFIMGRIKEKTDAPPGLIVEFIKYVIHNQNQSVFLLPQSMDWDGFTPLGHLFNCELKSGNENYFDQKFIDYLAANPEKMQIIHWRNFERFCAEYFQRLGYETVLGPGTNDGGIDIRVFDKSDPSTPLILIQCKRYKKTKEVKIETVKALYADVKFLDAKHGLIATTSYIAPGGKKMSEARKYPLSFVENEQVKNWASDMWRYSK